MKQKNTPVCHFTKGRVCVRVRRRATLCHNVPDHSSMLPCSGKSQTDRLSFLSLWHLTRRKGQSALTVMLVGDLPSQQLG